MECDEQLNEEGEDINMILEEEDRFIARIQHWRWEEETKQNLRRELREMEIRLMNFNDKCKQDYDQSISDLRD